MKTLGIADLPSLLALIIRGRIGMKKLAVASSVLTLSLWTSWASAGPITGPAKALLRFEINNTTPFTATDYHLKIESPEGENLTLLRARRVTAPPTSDTSGNNTPTLTMNFLLPGITSGISDAFEIQILQQNNEIRVVESFWTAKDVDGNTIPIGDAKIPGFDVKGDPIYTIYNDFSDPIGIRNLQFLVNVPELSLDSITTIESIPGFGSTISDFALSPNSFLAFNIPENLDPGSFLYTRGQIFDVTSGVVVGTFLQGHQSPVPEPTSIALFIIGLGSLLLLRLLRERKKGAGCSYMVGMRDKK